MPADTAGAAVVHRTVYVPSPLPAQPPSQSASIATPVLLGLCCLGLILFLIAATIVLSLIPIYTKAHGVSNVPRTRTSNLIFSLPAGSTLPVGTLNQDQLNVLRNALQQSLNSNPRTRGITITGISSTAGNSGTSSSSTASFLGVSVNYTCGEVVLSQCQQIVANLLQNFAVTPALDNQLTNLATPSTTTTTAAPEVTATTAAPAVTATTAAPAVTTTTLSATTNATRVIARRSLTEGGAPAAMVYIDFHQMAGIKGDVSSVSFYVDRTCALAEVEFAAFELIYRDTDTDKAQLKLIDRSGSIKLPEATKMKPYMSAIRIQLCHGISSDKNECQGTKFSVLPHQYIGIRSGSCRLGYAEPMPSAHITTWTHVEGLDPFAQPYKALNYVPAAHTILQSVQIDPSESATKTERKSSVTFEPRVFFLGSYPPRQCGVAKFLQDLTNSYQGPYGIGAVDEQDSSARNYSEKIVFRLNQTDRDAYYQLAEIINSQPYDIVNLQHEYGLYGGLGGEYVLALLGAIRKPVVTTFHTILAKPNAFFLSLTRAICATSTQVVVLSNLGRRLLIDVYGIDDSKISIVYHGVPDVQYEHQLSDSKAQLGLPSDAPLIATFGLLHRNKNIQLTLRALPAIVKAAPNVQYLIIGQTHPLVKKQEGESYRQELEKNITALGLTNNVRFINEYLDDDKLVSYLKAVDIYLTPYFHEEQYVSGTLSWAVGLGKAVVSTPYLYAKELLSNGRGFLVPFEDDQYLSTILTSLIQDDHLRNRARRTAYHFGRQMTWSTVSSRLQDLSDNWFSSNNH